MSQVRRTRRGGVRSYGKDARTLDGGVVQSRAVLRCTLGVPGEACRHNVTLSIDRHRKRKREYVKGYLTHNERVKYNNNKIQMEKHLEDEVRLAKIPHSVGGGGGEKNKFN
jgi:hypothetical protein